VTPGARQRACARVAVALDEDRESGTWQDARGRTRASGRGRIRLRQAQALALRRLGATWAEVAESVGLTAAGATGAARAGEALEARDPDFARAVAGAAPPSVRGARALAERAPIGGRRGGLMRSPPRSRRAPDGMALIADVPLDLPGIAASLAWRGPWSADDADDAVQAAAAWAWHQCAALPVDPARARATLRRWALRRLIAGGRRARPAPLPDGASGGPLPDPESTLALLEAAGA
jgi:hypothetical protein